MSRFAVFAAVGIVGMLLGGVASAADPQPAQEKSTTMQAPVATPFGTLPDGRSVNLWTLEVPGGWKATISEYGAILTSLHVPAKEAGGAPVDVVLGFDSVEPYGKGHPYFGATCGRVSNRIAKGAFELDGKAYTLATNNGVNHLPGGQLGFDKHLWKAVPHFAGNSPSLELTTVSPDGEEGYPGKLTAKVVYTLTPAGELIVDMSATTDAATIVNMVHHSYWNMAGQSSGHVGPQQLTVNADTVVSITAVTPTPGVRVVTPMPMTVARGERAKISFEYTPTAPGPFNVDAVLRTSLVGYEAIELSGYGVATSQRK